MENRKDTADAHKYITREKTLCKAATAPTSAAALSPKTLANARSSSG